MIKRKTINYLNNDDLVKAVLEWQSACREADKQGKEWPRQSDYIGRCIMLICNGLGSKSNFSNYSYRDEMVDDAIEACINALKSFDATRVGPKTGKVNNAFNYLTMVAFRAMQRRIITEKKQNYIKHKRYQHFHFIDEAGTPQAEWLNNDVSNRIISEFEEKHLNNLTKQDKLNKNKALQKKLKKEKLGD